MILKRYMECENYYKIIKSMDTKILIKIAIVLVSFLIIVCTYLLYQESLFQQSLEIIEYLQ